MLDPDLERYLGTVFGNLDTRLGVVERDWNYMIYDSISQRIIAVDSHSNLTTYSSNGGTNWITGGHTPNVNNDIEGLATTY